MRLARIYTTIVLLVAFVTNQEIPQVEEDQGTFEEGRGDSLYAPEDESDYQYDACKLKFTYFQQECDIETMQLSAFRLMMDDSIAACCWKPECCDQFVDILEEECLVDGSCYLQNDFEQIQLMGMYHMLCNDPHELPTCEEQDTQIIPSECQQLNEQLMTECGFRNVPTESFVRARDDTEASCCWSGTCCDLATDYYEKGCDISCWANQSERLELGSYPFGNGVADTWSRICMLPEDDKICTEGNDLEALDMPYIDFRASAYSTEGGLTEVELAQQQQDLLNSEGICGETIEYFTNSDFGQEGQLTSTIRTFCNLTLTELRASAPEAVSLCCDITNEMLKGACEYSDCHPTHPLNLFTPLVYDILSLWQIVCNPIVDGCDLDAALSVSSGGAYNQLQLIEEDSDKDQADTFSSRNQASQVFTVQPQLQHSHTTALPILPSPTPNPQSAPVPNVNVQTEGISIFRALERIPMLSTFNYAIQYLDLETTLNSHEKPITMFVPTNSAFNEFGRALGVSANSIIESIGGTTWTAIHLVHVSLFTLNPEDLNAGDSKTLFSLESGMLTVDSHEEGGVEVFGCCSPLNHANVVSSAVFSDGILWVIDSLILPTVIAEDSFG